MRWAVKIALAVLVIGGAMYLFIFPARTYLAQKQDIAVQEHTIAALQAEDSKLASESHALQGAPTIEKIARQEYGLVKPGQQAFMVVPARTKPAPAPPPPPVKHAAWYSSLEFWHYL
jgi:cell division protein FtsB